MLDKQKDRNYAISAIRFLSMLMIITCHFLQYLGMELAWWFNVGVQIFFVISGFLYGGKAISKPIEFYKKSFKKILIPYWTFLIIVVLVQIILAPDIFSWGKTFLAFLCVGRIDGIEHLWFVQKILIGYLLLPLLLLIRDEILKMKGYIAVISTVFVFVLFQFVGFTFNEYSMSANNINCFAIGILLTCILKKTNSLIKPTIVFITLAVVTNALRIYYSYIIVIKNNAIYNLFVKYAHGLLGIAIFLVLYQLFKNIKGNALLRFSDSYSYHIYLVHQVFILGPLSLMSITTYLFLNIVTICFCILISGILLKQINVYADKALKTIGSKFIKV